MLIRNFVNSLIGSIIRDEKARKAKEERLKRANARFGKSPFVALVLRELKFHNWSTVDSMPGCEILPDKIVTLHKTYVYKDNGLNNLDQWGCQALAEYLAQFYPGECTIIEKKEFFGGHTGGYTANLNSDGGVSVSPNYIGGERWKGYIIRKEMPKSTAPQGKDW